MSETNPNSHYSNYTLYSIGRVIIDLIINQVEFSTAHTKLESSRDYTTHLASHSHLKENLKVKILKHYFYHMEVVQNSL